jgi:hypothetical protein
MWGWEEGRAHRKGGGVYGEACMEGEHWRLLSYARTHAGLNRQIADGDSFVIGPGSCRPGSMMLDIE